jgi:hypothetical protein
MKTHVLLLAILVVGLAVPSMAQTDVYDNGPTNGTVDAWTINFGFVVSDTFTLSSHIFSLDGLSFSAWLFPGDILQSAEVSITSSEFGGTTFFDGTVNFTQSNCVYNQFGFDVCNEAGSFSTNPLNAGTYWLNLQNAVVTSGNPVYWDENNGPSFASENSIGTIPSESFTVLGGGCIGCGCTLHPDPDCGPPESPEPSGLLLFSSGALALFGAGGLSRFFY